MKRKTVIALLSIALMSSAVACRKNKVSEEDYEALLKQVQELESAKEQETTEVEPVTFEFETVTIEEPEVQPVEVNTDVAPEIIDVIQESEVSVQESQPLTTATSNSDYENLVEVLEGDDFYSVDDWRLWYQAPKVMDLVFHTSSFNSYSFTWKDKDFRLPFAVSDFEATLTNEELNDTAKDTDAYLRPKEMTVLQYRNDSYVVSLTVTNQDTIDKPLYDCNVICFRVRAYPSDSSRQSIRTLPFSMPNGIQSGVLFDDTETMELELGGTFNYTYEGSKTAGDTMYVNCSDVEYIDCIGNVEIGKISYGFDNKCDMFSVIEMWYTGTYYGG